MTNNLENVFNKYNGVMSTSQLLNEGYYYLKIKELLDSGKIEQLKRGYYRYGSEILISDIPTIITLFPDGIISRESALDYYGYTDRIPSFWHISVSSTSTRTRFHIEYPLVKPHFIIDERLEIGLTKEVIDGYLVRIYDRERTICDILTYRNSIDSEIFNTAIQRYVNDSKKSIVNLMKYAKILKVERKVREVLGIWL